MKPFIMIFFIGLSHSFWSQVDSLRPQGDEYAQIVDLISFHDSLLDNSDTVRLSWTGAYNRKYNVLTLKGANIGLSKSYYSDGSLCQEALFDTLPELKKWSNSGVKHERYVTIPKYYKHYYKNGKLRSETYFKQKKDTSVNIGYPYHWEHELRIDYYRNGHESDYSLKKKDISIERQYDLHLRLWFETIIKKRKYTYSSYSYSDQRSSDTEKYTFDFKEIHKAKVNPKFEKFKYNKRKDEYKFPKRRLEKLKKKRKTMTYRIPEETLIEIRYYKKRELKRVKKFE